MTLSRAAALALTASVVACGNATPAPVSVPAAGSASSLSAMPPLVLSGPPDGPMPRLRTGALTPVEVPGELALKLVGRHVGEGYELLEGELPADVAVSTVAVDVRGKQPSPLAFVALPSASLQQATTHRVVWVRRPVSDAPVTGDLFAEASSTTPGQHRRFRIADTGGRPGELPVRIAWLEALARHVEQPQRSAWNGFAAARLTAMAEALDVKPRATNAGGKPGPAPRAQVAPQRPQTHDDLAELMETTTGATAVQEAIQQNRGLFLQAAKEPATLPLSSLQLPSLAHHPWARMMGHLGPPPAEAFAADAPADFYYVRAADLPSLFRLLDQVDAWGTPAANVLDAAAEERDVSTRYETQLALRRGPLTRALGPSVIGEVAVVGSDPYVKEGSDVTVMLRVKNRALFDVALAGTLADLEQAHGKLTRETRDHAGTTVHVARSADGAVAQQRATAGDVEVVSNSPGAIDLVLDTIQGRHPRLADEPDFRFMLARDAGERADVLAYMGDRFVGEVIGPRQKVLEARREIALGELETPGFAALLFGVMQGKSPATLDELVAAGLLTRDELRHATGAPIAWQPGGAARSKWGTPAAMTPLIDLPSPLRVTASEKASYERFARSYQNEWSAYIDPVALRLAFDGQTVNAVLRELPLIDGTDYHDIASFVGAARFASRPIDGGARTVIGIGADSDPRRELSQTLRGFSSHHELKLDFLGDWAAFGVADRSVLAEALLAFADDKDVAQMPGGERHTDRFDLLVKLPAYVEIAVRSGAQAAIALAAVRVLANETIPGMFDWGEAARHRDVPMVRITLKGGLTHGLLGDLGDVTIFYAVTEGALIVTLQQWVLERLIDEQLDGTGPRAKPASDPESTQLSVELASQPGKGLSAVVAWLLEGKMMSGWNASHAAAETLFQGAPEIAGDPAAVRALALAYFGATPVTPDGAAYTPARDGARDPARGNEYAPIWPDVPVPGSPLARVMQALSRVRTQVAFDDEGKDDAGKAMRSLHARASFGLR